LLPHAARELRRSRLRPHLPQRRADDEKARLQRRGDRRHPGGQPAETADVRLETTEATVIRKLSSGEYRLYSRKTDPKTGKRRNLGTFKSRAAAEAHERAVQFFKRRG